MTYKTPPPGSLLSEDTSQNGTEGVGHSYHSTDNSLVLSTVLEGHNIANDDHTECQDTSAAKTLDGTKDDQLDHGLKSAKYITSSYLSNCACQ